MENYFLLKMVHILSAVVIAGTGTGIAFFMYMANRSSNIAAIAVTARHVVIADWLFTAPAVIIQFVTGVLLMHKLGYSFSSTWFYAVITLFLFVGICWLPVLKIQYTLKSLAETSLASGKLHQDFKKLMQYWVVLGVPAFTAILVIFWLMVFKPLPVV
ncbi:DUF2269 domain-containing protein [Microbulbifer salipaludis]|uniref:DUF2269 domain-containing protein n=1 Tax=Microbulbifer salipaludis TaxID=187980 RepID=A0ABS3E7Z9_9GAMM|nr:DUF2269 domain-containing protein [Microbulbifer salipaludis]MBN8431427.1 DUF2269 domain-containing protein [Microbulbifer salipaludis]